MVLHNGQYLLSQINLQAWNIKGIFQRINSFRYNKLNDIYVRDLLLKNKVFGLLETHHTSKEIGDLDCFPEYKVFNLCRPQTKNKHFKASRGIAVYIHESLRPGILKVPYPGTESLWLKFKTEFFGLLVVRYCKQNLCLMMCMMI